VQLGGTRHRGTSARVTANEDWDSLFALSLCSVGNKVLYTADQPGDTAQQHIILT
jgi:hypothetical protein